MLKWGRPFFVVHESDPKHSGKPWAELVLSCPVELDAGGRFGALPEDYLTASGVPDLKKWERAGWFERPAEAPTLAVTHRLAELVVQDQEPILWHRLPAFQQIALRQIGEQTLRHPRRLP